MITQEPRIHQWSRDEYNQLGDLGLFQDKRVELIEGEIFEMSPMKSDHATGIGLASDVLRQLFSPGFIERTQQPLALGQKSEPEPDLAYVRGGRREFKHRHPTTAALIVEVAESSLQYDRTIKASLYAKAGIPDYWIVNLVERQVEVFRDPVPNPSGRYGYNYHTVTIHSDAESIAALSHPGAPVAVSDLLP